MMGKAYGFHSRALRVIGQDLAELVPKHLVMELHGADFVANGLWSRCRVEDQSLPTAWTGFKKFFDKITDTIVRVPTREPDLEFVPFSRTYNVNDIERLDEQRAICRAGASNMPDIYSLGERLRTIGKVVDGRNGRIVRIFKDLHQIIFEYQDAAGKTQKEELSNSELYQLQKRYAAERGDAIANGMGEG